jgi:tetratricopeptide (TPR) repeat protein
VRHGWCAAAALAAVTLVGLGACSSTPPRTKAPAATPAAGSTGSKTAPSAAAAPAGSAAAPKAAAAGAGGSAGGAGAPAAGAAGAAAGASGTAAVHPEVPPAARADFERAVKYMRAGNAVEAELGFKQVALQYPQFSAPLVNLAIMQRKDGHLDQAETTLKDAVGREGNNAIAWTELGATQRLRGEFRDAATSYEKAIAVDPRYAPAWRNLGVVSDLYLGDPSRALKAFEQYKELTGEDKPVSGWIAELRQRLGLPAKRPAVEAAPGGGESKPGAPGGAQPSKGTPSEKPPTDHPQAQPATSPVNAAASAADGRTGG